MLIWVDLIVVDECDSLVMMLSEKSGGAKMSTPAERGGRGIGCMSMSTSGQQADVNDENDVKREYGQIYMYDA